MLCKKTMYIEICSLDNVKRTMQGNTVEEKEQRPNSYDKIGLMPKLKRRRTLVKPRIPV